MFKLISELPNEEIYDKAIVITPFQTNWKKILPKVFIHPVENFRKMLYNVETVNQVLTTRNPLLKYRMLFLIDIDCFLIPKFSEEFEKDYMIIKGIKYTDFIISDFNTFIKPIKLSKDLMQFVKLVSK